MDNPNRPPAACRYTLKASATQTPPSPPRCATSCPPTPAPNTHALKSEAVSRWQVASWAATDGEPAGTTFNYNELCPLAVGMVIRAVTGQSLAAFAEAALWQPIGAEADATSAARNPDLSRRLPPSHHVTAAAWATVMARCEYSLGHSHRARPFQVADGFRRGGIQLHWVRGLPAGLGAARDVGRAARVGG